MSRRIFTGATLALIALMLALAVPMDAAIVAIDIVTSSGSGADTFLYVDNWTGDGINYNARNFGAGTLVQNSPYNLNIYYPLIRFDLSAIPAGAVVTAASVTVQLSFRDSATPFLPDYPSGYGYKGFDSHVYGLIQASTQEAWVEGNGDHGGLPVDNNPPGEVTWNNTTTLRSHIDTGTLLGVLSVPTPYAIGQTYSVPSSANLVAFLNAAQVDRTTGASQDSLATFYFVPQGATNDNLIRYFITSKEGAGTYAAPTLSLTYFIPEPASLALLGLGLLGLGRRRRGGR